MNKNELLEKLNNKLNPTSDYNLSNKSGKYIISTEVEMSSKAPKWFSDWSEQIFLPIVKSIDTRLDNVEKRLDNVEKRLDVIEDKLERNNIK